MAGSAATSDASKRESESGEPRLPGRPRSVEAEQTILKVAGEMLSEGGFVSLNYDALAARARCSKATIYRRWSSKGHLAVAALAQLPDPPTTPDRGNLRTELVELLAGIARVFAETPAIKIMQSLIGERARNPEIADLLDGAFRERRRGLSAVLQRGIERGELRVDTDVELLMDLIVGPILCRYLCTGVPVDQELLDGVVELALAAHGRED